MVPGGNDPAPQPRRQSELRRGEHRHGDHRHGLFRRTPDRSPSSHGQRDRRPARREGCCRSSPDAPQALGGREHPDVGLHFARFSAPAVRRGLPNRPLLLHPPRTQPPTSCLPPPTDGRRDGTRHVSSHHQHEHLRKLAHPGVRDQGRALASSLDHRVARLRVRHRDPVIAPVSLLLFGPHPAGHPGPHVAPQPRGSDPSSLASRDRRPSPVGAVLADPWPARCAPVQRPGPVPHWSQRPRHAALPSPIERALPTTRWCLTLHKRFALSAQTMTAPVPSRTRVADDDKGGVKTSGLHPSFINVCPAASYSPTPSPVQYHRR